MHAYLCLAGQASVQEARERVERGLRSVLSVLADIGAEPEITVLPIPELNGALGTIAPASDYAPRLLQIHRTHSLLALCYGGITGVAESAERVASAFGSSGGDALRSFDGSYATVVADLARRELWVASDLIGMRAPSWVQGESRIAVASHDLLHVAAGQVPGEFDLDSLAAFVSCDWSVGGHSLVKGVRRHRPWHTLSWSRNSGTKIRQLSPMATGSRLEAADSGGISRRLDEILEEMLQTTRRFVQANPVVHASLTAGLDSRGVLALLVKANPKALTLSTSGLESTPDVRVAKQLARLVGAAHRSSIPGPPKLVAFEQTNRLRAFATDGISDARRAMGALPRWNPKRHVQAGGEGGEILRGFFYQYFGAQGIVPSDVEGLAKTLLRWRFRRVGTLKFADRGASARVRERLCETLAEYLSLGEGGYDALDLLYLYERYGQWGAASERTTWNRRWSPYEAKVAIALGFGLPQPIGTRCTIVPRAVQRYLPRRAYWVPLNGYSLIALEGSGRVRFALRQALKVLGKASERVASTEHRPKTSKGMRADWLVSEYTRALVGDPRSLARDLFGKEGIETMLDEQRERRVHTETLARLLAAEELRRLVAECRQP